MRPFHLAILALPIATAAPAQEARDAVRALDELGQCRALTADAERLACFDRIVGRIAAARRSGELLAFDREAVATERRVRFGLADVPNDAGSEAAARAAKVRELSSTITGVAQAPGFGRWDLTLANGQVWRMLDGDRYGPRAGAPIKLITTVTGGFRASVDRGQAVQVRRIR